MVIAQSTLVLVLFQWMNPGRAEIQFNDYWVLLIDILGFSRHVSDPKTRKDLVAGYIEVVENSVRKNVVGEVVEQVAPEDRPKISEEWLKRVRVFRFNLHFLQGP